MGGNGETFVGESRGENLLFGIDEDIVDLPALLADEMFVPFHHRVKVLGASQGQHLEFFLSHQFLKIAIDCPQADVWNDGPNLSEYLVRRGVESLVFDRLPNYI